MIERYVLHVTMTTGHRRRSFRSEVADKTVHLLRPLLNRALTGEHVRIPGFPDYTMTGGVQGRCCVVTVYGDRGEGTDPRRVPVVSIGVGAYPRCANQTWERMHETPVEIPLATDPKDPPPAPWVADRIEVGAALFVDAMRWAGDFSRSIAWTWIELRGI